MIFGFRALGFSVLSLGFWVLGVGAAFSMSGLLLFFCEGSKDSSGVRVQSLEWDSATVASAAHPKP